MISRVPQHGQSDPLHDIRLILQHSSFVGVHVEVVRSGEDGHNRWKPGSLRLPVHTISSERQPTE